MYYRFYIFQFILLLTTNTAFAQNLHYFEFRTSCGHGAWQDTSFVAVTATQSVIDTVLANLAHPLEQRQFISGAIAYGNGGFNRNGSHWFLWHFLPDQWSLTDFAAEVCDGCPFSDVDKDTAYWVNNIGYFCPWSGQPVREITGSVGIPTPTQEPHLSIYPTPARHTLNIDIHGSEGAIKCTIFTLLGKEVLAINTHHQNNPIDISRLPEGIYQVRIETEHHLTTRKLVIERP